METQRNLAIDRFRGLAIFLMVIANYLGGVELVPAFLKHAPDIGFTVIDTIAPMFIFAIGLTYRPSFEKRLKQQGALSAYMHFVTRYFALVGIGALFTAGGTTVAGEPTDWGVLQAIGVAGLICLLFIRLNPYQRFAAGATLLVVYQFALDHWILQPVLSSVQGGFYGTVSWGAMLVIATAMADMRRKGLRPYVLSCVLIAAVAIASLFLVPVSKHRVSLSYVAITLAISGLVYLLFELGSRFVKNQPGYLCWWGENPMALYILHLFILGLFELPNAEGWYAQAPIWLVMVQLGLLIGLVSFAAWDLHRHRILIKL
jgi:predicted acyltransferase